MRDGGAGGQGRGGGDGELLDAVADPAQLSGYFSTGGAEGRLEAGSTVTWDFHDFPGAFPVEVVDVATTAKTFPGFATVWSDAVSARETAARASAPSS